MPPRRHRRNYNDPNHAHELTFSCYRRFPFLRSARTCRWLAESIQQARERWRFDVWAFVFMPDHAHLIVHPNDAVYDMAMIRRAIKAPVARKAITFLEQEAPHWLLKITRQRGQIQERLFWQSGGGYDRNIIRGATLMGMIDYLHQNPVRAGLVCDPREWTWSSAKWYAHQQLSPVEIDPLPPEWLEDVEVD